MRLAYCCAVALVACGGGSPTIPAPDIADGTTSGPPLTVGSTSEGDDAGPSTTANEASSESGAPPGDDEPDDDEPGGEFPVVPGQMDKVCERGSNDPVAAKLCAADPAAIDSLAALLDVLGLAQGARGLAATCEEGGVCRAFCDVNGECARGDCVPSTDPPIGFEDLGVCLP